MGLPEHAYRAPNIVVLAYVVKSITLIVMPWYVCPHKSSDTVNSPFW